MTLLAVVSVPETWTHFLLRNIDPKLLRRLNADAKQEGRSFSDLVRSRLCEHYELDCPPSGAHSKWEFGARTQLLKLQPELFQAIKEDAAETGLSMRGLVLEALEARYVTESEEVA